ncbi:MAG: primosomal protein N', partial [Armatimonadetes bacterium]|nr:primosomal protein N' [Armatimonadota bacterium]NIM24468.1 primosomal protein N' [Armatimonadota bacterium]NIM68339.1 primosomal protein N' [Armatimonadota bacterium]NIM76743.1 primosomal protein N' [Armatimonadota bacterium]NIN06542.1 primosomal protein N' [Armatimonadota bacterium]
ERLAQRIREKKGKADLEILGPAPAPLAKLKDRYRYHILLRTTEAGLIQRVLNGMQEDLVSHGRIHVVVDVDPVSLM